jgi:hypothetical protein
MTKLSAHLNMLKTYQADSPIIIPIPVEQNLNQMGLVPTSGADSPAPSPGEKLQAFSNLSHCELSLLG